MQQLHSKRGWVYFRGWAYFQEIMVLSAYSSHMITKLCHVEDERCSLVFFSWLRGTVRLASDLHKCFSVPISLQNPLRCPSTWCALMLYMHVVPSCCACMLCSHVVHACCACMLCPHVDTLCPHVGLHSGKMCLHTVPVKFDTNHTHCKVNGWVQ